MDRPEIWTPQIGEAVSFVGAAPGAPSARVVALAADRAIVRRADGAEARFRISILLPVVN